MFASGKLRFILNPRWRVLLHLVYTGCPAYSFSGRWNIKIFPPCTKDSTCTLYPRILEQDGSRHGLRHWDQPVYETMPTVYSITNRCFNGFVLDSDIVRDTCRSNIRAPRTDCRFSSDVRVALSRPVRGSVFPGPGSGALLYSACSTTS